LGTQLLNLGDQSFHSGAWIAGSAARLWNRWQLYRRNLFVERTEQRLERGAGLHAEFIFHGGQGWRSKTRLETAASSLDGGGCSTRHGQSAHAPSGHEADDQYSNP
jgi:hypothetical protein